MKRAFVTAIAFACLTSPALAGPVCGLPLPVIENATSGNEGSLKLNPIIAQAFLDQFNASGPQTSYQAPVWVIDHPKEDVIEIIATYDGQGCAFVAPGAFRQIVLKMLYGQST